MALCGSTAADDEVGPNVRHRKRKATQARSLEAAKTDAASAAPATATLIGVADVGTASKVAECADITIITPTEADGESRVAKTAVRMELAAPTAVNRNTRQMMAVLQRTDGKIESH